MTTLYEFTTFGAKNPFSRISIPERFTDRYRCISQDGLLSVKSRNDSDSVKIKVRTHYDEARDLDQFEITSTDGMMPDDIEVLLERHSIPRSALHAQGILVPKVRFVDEREGVLINFMQLRSYDTTALTIEGYDPDRIVAVRDELKVTGTNESFASYIRKHTAVA